MNEVIISVIIPVYNTEKYIENCLNSVINQHYNLCEVIIVNDGSTDSSENVVERIIADNPTVAFKYIKQENMGLSEARNRGLQEASGKYIIWLDSDDSLVDGILVKLDAILRDNLDLVICRIASFSENNRKITPCKYVFPDTQRLGTQEAISILMKTKGFWYAAWCLIPSRELLLSKDLKFLPGIYHEDELWTPSVIVSSKSVCFFNECYYLNTSFREGSIITKKNIKKEFDKLKVCIRLKEQKHSIEKYKVRFINKRILIILYTVFSSLQLYKNDDKYTELKSSFYSTLKDVYGVFSSVICALFYLKKLIY